MHFRHFLISSLLVFAAMFLPDNAYAENNKHSEKRLSEKASVQATTSVETEKIAVQTNITTNVENSTQVKKTVEIPEAAIPIQGKGNEKPVKEIPILKSSQKPAIALKNIPEHVKGDTRSKVKKDKKVAGIEKTEKNSKLVKNKLMPNKATNEAVGDSLHNTDKEVKNKAHLGELISTKESKATESKKEGRFESNEPEALKQEKTPASEEEIPKASQAISPMQRSNGSGGQTHDRISNGLSTISFLEKWFVWTNHYELRLVQPYLSRYARMNNQWVNAPPSQPPQEAPLLKAVSRC